MKLLIVTQTVDSTDSSLGFFHAWIEKMATSFDSVEVICLYEGVHELPANVSVHSLGKEKGSVSRLHHSLHFLSLIWHLRNQYDRVFVHMNQEYVLLGGLVWNVFRKPVYLWRNHYAGSVLTRLAGVLSTRVFYTSIHSYTAGFANASHMPVGVDTELFSGRSEIRTPRSILFLGRIAPAKRPDVLLEALILLAKRNIDFTASFYGPTLPEHKTYAYALKTRVSGTALEDRVSFHEGIPHSQTPAVYQAHDIYVNLSASGMFDKTLFEAAMSGCLVLATSDDFQDKLGHTAHYDSQNPESLATALGHLIALPENEKERMRQELRDIALEEGLDSLMKKVSSAILA